MREVRPTKFERYFHNPNPPRELYVQAAPGRILYNLWMAKILSFTHARNHLTELLDEVEGHHEHVVITRNGRPAAVVLSQDEYDTLIETLEVLADEELLEDLAASERDLTASHTTPWAEVKKELSLG